MNALARLTVAASCAAVVIAGGAACSPKAEAKQYPVTGQVLSVNREKQQITIKHEDIPNFMPGMTMSFPVAKPELLNGREPGELVTATLEVVNALGTITSVTRTGMAPLPLGSSLAGAVLGVGDPIPDAAFLDQANARRSISDWRGKVMVITFVYARCPLPNFCPLMNQNFAKIQKAAGADAALKGHTALISVSFDPENDTPDVLAAEAKRYGADPAVWSFLTGDRATIERFSAAMGVGLTREPGSTEIVHNLRTIVVDPKGRITAIFSSNDWTTSAVLDAMRSAVTK